MDEEKVFVYLSLNLEQAEESTIPFCMLGSLEGISLRGGESKRERETREWTLE